MFFLVYGARYTRSFFSTKIIILHDSFIAWKFYLLLTKNCGKHEIFAFVTYITLVPGCLYTTIGTTVKKFFKNISYKKDLKPLPYFYSKISFSNAPKMALRISVYNLEQIVEIFDYTG